LAVERRVLSTVLTQAAPNQPCLSRNQPPAAPKVREPTHCVGICACSVHRFTIGRAPGTKDQSQEEKLP
jgi:hypothetical protein